MQTKRNIADTEPENWIYDKVLAVKILVAGFIIAALLVVGGVFMSNKQDTPTSATTHSVATFADKRKLNPTRLTQHKPAPQQFDNKAPAEVQVVSYQSDGRKLLAWMVLPQRKPPYPAILFAHGGMALGAEDVEQAKPFINSGYAVFFPTWRGENGNPGDFEMCFGEVDDAVAATNYLASRKDIDKNNIFGVGHSIGGTVIMLAAELTPKLRKVAACGGFPDMAAAGKAYDLAPFDDHNIEERELRSPALHISDLHCPMLLLYGSNDRGDLFFFDQAQRLAPEAQKFNKTVVVEMLQNTDHLSAMIQGIPKMIAFFETGPQ